MVLCPFNLRGVRCYFHLSFNKPSSLTSKIDGVEDSKTTIEFLRGRLLAERSASRTAKQRADELAQMVSPIV